MGRRGLRMGRSGLPNTIEAPDARESQSVGGV